MRCDFECGAVVPVDNVAGAESRPSILDNTRASNANASLSCLCTVFVMTNRIGMSGADLSPRSDIKRSTARRLDSRFDIGMAGKE